MCCIYNEQFKVNKNLLRIINSFESKKILVVNGFREKGKKALDGMEAFSLEEEKIKKDDPLYFKKLILKYKLKVEELIYFDHDEKNVETAMKLGILSLHYKNDEEVRKFLQKNLC